ncbi:MAG TPA: IS4 family transposase [Anaeromyxobacteraceae bacterium]|nr:IS4 family transposase [Anaeromyxobacteraceae bacterium]
MSDQPLDRDRITKLVSTIFADDLHAKRVASLAGAAVGVLEGAALGIHAIGNALAMAEGLKTKHAVKQVDRLLSNNGISVWSLFASWVPFVVGDRPEVVTALDWTDFDDDDQSTIVLSMITSHGRATPLLWKTVTKSELKGWRNEHEDVLLERFREVLPEGVKVTVLADRGFGDQALYELLKDQLGFDFVVRFRGIVKVTSADGETKAAKDWVPANGRPLLLRGAQVTRAGRALGGVVCVKAKGMKEAWHLATSHGDRAGAEIVALYGKRFTIEESFRDQKNLRFGMGLSDTRIGDPDRRDRLLLISAIAIALLTILGAAGEAIGIDRYLKANTVKRRTISLLRQGLMHYGALPKMKLDMLEPLMAKFGEMLRAQRVFREIFGLI